MTDKNNGKIAVIGDKDSVMAFKGLGVRVFSDLNPYVVRDTLKQLARDKCAVILITEKAAAEVSDAIARYRAGAYPVILLIPDSAGSGGAGIQGLKDNVEKAVGTDVIFKLKT